MLCQSMVQQLVFHIGDCKTGTTSIQTMLARGAWRGAGETVLYSARLNHNPLATRLRQGGIPAKTEAESLVKLLSQSRADIAVISAEHFEFCAPDVIGDLLDGPLAPWAGNVRLIQYVRPHLDRFRATFIERCKKGGWQGTMEAFADQILSEGLINYGARLSSWHRVFGDRLTVRPFVRSRFPNGDVRSDFLRWLFASDAATPTENAYQNGSLPIQQVVMMRLIHQIMDLPPDLRDGGRAFGWNFAPILTEHATSDPTPVLIPEAVAARLCTSLAADAATLDRMFDDTVFSTRLTDKRYIYEGEQSLDPEVYFSPDTLRVIRSFATLTERLIAADPAHFSWASREPEFRRHRPNKPKPAVHSTLRGWLSRIGLSA